jgi:glycine/D-amino acid oxidase-like deaminating enzyme
MLLWEIDRSLAQLTETYGFQRASRAYLASLHAVTGLKLLVFRLGVACEMRDKNSLHLAAGDTNKELLTEHQLRQRAGLPGDFLDHRTLLDIYGIARAGAIVSPGAADADPMQLARGLLRVAVARGARVFNGEAIEFDTTARSVGVELKNGRQIEAQSVILATGYVMPAIIHSTVQTISSSWAIATRPQPLKVWKDGALIWENSKDYLYARTTSGVLARKLAALWPVADVDIEFRWSGTFDTTSDGLPLIGPVPNAKGIYAAYGYGGNGITFSFLAAQLIGDLIAGSSSRLLTDFALDRDGGPTTG